MRLTALLVLAVLAAVAAVMLSQGQYGTALFLWATQQQRGFQNGMAGALQAIRGGDAWALATLCGLSAAYGFVHALGPGHGKLVLGATAATGVPARRMLVIGVASSLAQSLTAILLVAVGVKLLALTSTRAIEITETWLAAASYAAIGLIGLLMAWRGLRALWRKPHHHHHDHCGCGRSHGPSAEQIAQVSSTREALALIGSIAMRPCSGALFLLVIAWRFQIPWQGVLAVLAMGFGTAAFNSLAIGGGYGIRRIAGVAGRLGGENAQRITATLQLAAGGLIALIAAQMVRQFL